MSIVIHSLSASLGWSAKLHRLILASTSWASILCQTLDCILELKIKRVQLLTTGAHCLVNLLMECLYAHILGITLSRHYSCLRVCQFSGLVGRINPEDLFWRLGSWALSSRCLWLREKNDPFPYLFPTGLTMPLAGSGPSTLFSKWGVTHAQSFFWLSKKLGSTLQFPTFLFHLSCLIIRLHNNCCWWGGGGGGWRLLGFTRPWGMNVRASVARVILLWIIPWTHCKQQGCSFLLQTWLTLVHSVPKRLANGLALVPVPDLCCFYSGVFTDSIWLIFFKYSLGLKVSTGKEKKKTTKGSCDNVGRPGGLAGRGQICSNTLRHGLQDKWWVSSQQSGTRERWRWVDNQRDLHVY